MRCEKLEGLILVRGWGFKSPLRHNLRQLGRVRIRMAVPALDALREGYEVYLLVDAIGGTSVEIVLTERLLQE